MENRRSFLLKMGILTTLPLTFGLNTLYSETRHLKNGKRMPVMFIGHGSPMNIVNDNAFTKALHKIGQTHGKPTAILCISAHWLTRGTVVSVNPKPKTIYDFGGFPEALYQQKYEPNGHPELAREVVKAVQSIQVHEDHDMGLDHGAWAILHHMYPEQDVPVFQMSIDYNKPAQYHFDLAAELRALREKGVMIIGSGNIVHNLHRVDFSSENAPIMDWAQTFDETVKRKIDARDFSALINYQGLGKEAMMSIPTNDHYLPMIYTLGLLHDNESVEYAFEGFQHGSISMRCFQNA